MSSIFILNGESDSPLLLTVRSYLQRAGFSVSSDIATAENILYVVSPGQLANEAAHHFQQALTYHKRIIPLVFEVTVLVNLSPEIQRRSPIIFPSAAPSPNDPSATVLKQAEAMTSLVDRLHSNADYTKQHTELLVKALAWEHNGYDRKFLLRGDDFDSAQDWLSQADTENATTPSELHRSYIQASQGINQFYDVFISYGREDSKQFATQLYEQLSDRGFQVWCDHSNIPMGVDFQQQINDGIEKTDNFIYIISPHAVNSAYCNKEIEAAVKLNKRILPVLQVEEIDHSTWQQRNPGGTLADWAAYQAAGKHSSVPNMHPVIAKINWIYARSQDSLETAIDHLINSLSRHKRYVRQHTELLNKALAWDRHQRQSSYLLVGAERRQAQAWQATKFEQTQGPCTPTQIHDEFIAESIKAAKGGMTQVFISYSQTDKAIKDSVYWRLLQAGITVWTDTVDIQSGEDFEVAIQRGIEQADSVIYLISAASIQSDYCQKEIEVALKLNKRILPMLVEEIDASLIAETLRKIQFINLADNTAAIDLEEDVSKLLRTLRREEAYYQQHKQLLVKALKWQRQKENPSLLLQRQALKKYLAWVQIAKHRQQHAALPVQLQFLNASQQQPVGQTLDAFLCHHADDLDFSQRLNDTLTVQGKRTWFTPEGAAGEASEPKEMEFAIDNAENFLFVVSFSAIRSEACMQQLALAHSKQKRIVLVVYQSRLSSTVPKVFDSCIWSDFRRHGGDFLTNFGELFRILESDPHHVRSHTRLLVKATEWQNAQQDDSFLLRGSDLAASVEWLRQADGKTPGITATQRAYMQASQALPFRKIRKRTAVISTGLIALCANAVRLFGVFQPLEIAAYDQMLRLRPDEATQDERLLFVKVDSDSGEWLREQMIEDRYEPGIGTIPDEALSETISLLQRSGARLIGLDFFRDFPAEANLAKQFANSNNLIGICQSASRQVADIVSQDIPVEQIGVANLLLDGRKTVRRHYLSQWIDDALDGETTDPHCASPDTFSLLLSKRYLALEAENGQRTDQRLDYQDPFAQERIVPMQWGELAVPRIDGNGGGYSAMTGRWGWSDLHGYQTMLNYRTYERRVDAFAPSVSLSALLQGEVAAELIRDRIVLIGYTDFSDRNADDFNTPYADSVPGIYLHGQMVSQLINAVLENRPLIRWWPFWIEGVWILAWSAVGGVVFWRCAGLQQKIIFSVCAVGALSVSSYGLLVFSTIWVPWVPPLIGCGLSGAVVGYFTDRLRKG